MKKGDKVLIVENLDDHVGYKGEELRIVGEEENDYFIVENDKGLRWHPGWEELKLVESSECVEIDRLAYWDSEPHFNDEVHNGKKYGIYTHSVDVNDVDTDWMFSDADIVNVQWFETEKEQLLNFRDYKNKIL